MNLKCPKCGSGHGYKTLEDFRWWFECTECQYRILMMYYRDEFEKSKSK